MPRGHEHISFELSSAFFLDVIMIVFFPKQYTVKDRISNTKLEKGDHYYIQTRHEDLSLQNLILRKL